MFYNLVIIAYQSRKSPCFISLHAITPSNNESPEIDWNLAEIPFNLVYWLIEKHFQCRPDCSTYFPAVYIKIEYRVSHLKGALLWSCVQGRVFNTFCRYISQIKAKGCANRLVESHLWWCHFWRENSNVCYNSALQTVKIQMRHFLVNLIVKGVPG